MNKKEKGTRTYFNGFSGTERPIFQSLFEWEDSLKDRDLSWSEIIFIIGNIVVAIGIGVYLII